MAGRVSKTGVYRPDLGSDCKAKAQALVTLMTLLNLPGQGKNGQVTEAQAIRYAIEMAIPLLGMYIQGGGERNPDEAQREIFTAVIKHMQS